MDAWQAIVVMLFFIVLLLARHKSGRILTSLGVSMIVSSFLPYYSLEQIVCNIMAIDTLLCLAMFFMWASKDSKKAHAVGLISWFKVLISAGFLMSGMQMDWQSYALIINGAFILQVLSAGGLLNNVGTWLDNLLLKFAPKQYRMLRNVN